MTEHHQADCICDRRLDEFECVMCQRLVGWCKGGEGSDDVCDDCWATSREQEQNWTPEQQQALEDVLT